uniref:SCAN box domain-containing protein n=1 Tax=Chrysemys picta bellii TaxID=8478 RepID=A0A8C3J229_CHRPI
TLRPPAPPPPLLPANQIFAGSVKRSRGKREAAAGKLWGGGEEESSRGGAALAERCPAAPAAPAQLRFRSQDKTPEISYLQLAVRMEGYASKWADGAQTKEDLVKLLVLEQLYERCPSDLRLWLRDKKPENPRHAGQLADQFVKSRSGDNREESQRNSPTITQRESHHGTSQRENTEKPHQKGTSGVSAIRPTRGNPWDMGCYHYVTNWDCSYCGL